MLPEGEYCYHYWLHILICLYCRSLCKKYTELYAQKLSSSSPPASVVAKLLVSAGYYYNPSASGGWLSMIMSYILSLYIYFSPAPLLFPTFFCLFCCYFQYYCYYYYYIDRILKINLMFLTLLCAGNKLRH